MSALARGVLGAALALAALFVLGALSRAPYRPHPGEQAVLRFAWRARGERVEVCRRLTSEELERLPVHMRQEERCEGRVPPYRLRVGLDGVRVVDELFHAAGARHDRPLYVFRELFLSPGDHALAVAFARESEISARQRTGEELVLDTAVTLAPRRILLVTYDEEDRRLVVKDAFTR